MAHKTTQFTVEFEGDIIPVVITEIEEADDSTYMVNIPDYADFEIFLSEEDMWVSNDENAPEEDLIYIIGDQFESLQPE